MFYIRDQMFIFSGHKHFPKSSSKGYVRIGWKTAQSIYAESHRDELDAYNKAYRFLKKHEVDLNVNLDALQAEYEQLQTSHAAYTE